MRSTGTDYAAITANTAIRAVTAALLSAVLATTLPSTAQAQLVMGVHAVKAIDTLDGAMGVGVRAGIDPPIFPIDVIASGEYFFPDCGDDECSFWGGSIDANYSPLPFPILSPYASVGMSYRSFQLSDAAPEDTAIGPSVGVGINLSIAVLRAFGEVRYEFLDAPEKQAIIRVGLLF